MAITRARLLAVLVALAAAAPSGAAVGDAAPFATFRDDVDGRGLPVAGVGGLWAGGGRVLSPDTASDSAGSV